MNKHHVYVISTKNLYQNRFWKLETLTDFTSYLSSVIPSPF